MRTRVLWLLVMCAAELGGCELIADFDRGLLDASIPDTGTDDSDAATADNSGTQPK